MIAKVHRVKNRRICVEIYDDTLEKTMAKDVSSVSAAKKLMEYLNPEWELLQEVRIYRTKE